MRIDVVEDGLKVINDATGAEVRDVLWVDDATLQYAVQHPLGTYSVMYNAATGTTVWTVDEVVTPVASVTVNYATREIHLNTGNVAAVVTLLTKASHATPTPHPCTECRQEETCRRISYCAAYKCCFGEVDKP